MKIRFLGTAAAEGVPALFCVCDHCRLAWERGGKELRGRSGAMIDGVLKIDFGPDSFKQMLENRIDYTPLRSVLITHSHSDHLSFSDLGFRRSGFASLPADYPPLTVYGNAKVGEKLASALNQHLEFQEIHPFETLEIEGYLVTPLEAVHCVSADSDRFPVESRFGTRYRSEEALIYLIEKDGQSILYAHDTDELTPQVLDFLAGRHIDLISLDCTNGRLHMDYIGHMSAKSNLRMRELLLASGAADEHTLFVANHFSHNGLLSFEEMEALLPGFVISHDGMELSCPTR